MSGAPCTPARGLAGAAAALVLPGPSGLSREQLEVIYDAVADPGPGAVDDCDDSHDGWCLDDDGEASDLGHLSHVDQLAQPVVPGERDLVWWGWCAEQVAAGGPTAADPVVAAGAGCHWQHQRALAAARGRAAIAEADAAAAARSEQAAAFSVFTTRLAGVDEDTQAQVGSAAAERAAIATAAAVRDDLRAAQVTLSPPGPTGVWWPHCRTPGSTRPATAPGTACGVMRTWLRRSSLTDQASETVCRRRSR